MAKKFLIDVNVPVQVCHELRREGLDAIHLTWMSPTLMAAEDIRIVEWLADDVTVVTHDKEFPSDNKIVLEETDSADDLVDEVFEKLVWRYGLEYVEE